MSVTGGSTVTGSRSTEFIRSVKYSMVERDIDSPAELHRLMKEYAVDGEIASRATIYGYFNGTITPQPWFLRALEETYKKINRPLSPEEWERLHGTYIGSY